MDRKAFLSDLARHVQEATAARDWEALARTNSRMAETLPMLVAQGDWLALEKAALNALILAHSESYECCMRELALLEHKLEEMRANKDGWIAYALTASPDETKS